MVRKDEILTFINDKTNISKKELDIEFESIEHKNIGIHDYSPHRYKYSSIELCENMKSLILVM